MEGLGKETPLCLVVTPGGGHGQFSVLSSNPTARVNCLAARPLSSRVLGEVSMERMQKIAREQDILDVLEEGETLLFKHSPT